MIDKRLTIHVRSKNRSLMFKQINEGYDSEFNKETFKSKIFTTFAYKVKYNITKDDIVKQYITSLNQSGYKVTKYYLSNIK